MLIADYIAGKVFVSLFIIICAISDLRIKAIDLRLFYAAAILEAVTYVWMIFKGVSVDFTCMAIGVSVGVLILIIAGITRGQIGLGDAIFFVITGIAIGGYRNILLCAGGMLAGALYGLIVHMIRFIRGKSVKGYSFAFIPLLAPIGMVILICA